MRYMASLLLTTPIRNFVNGISIVHKVSAVGTDIGSVCFSDRRLKSSIEGSPMGDYSKRTRDQKEDRTWSGPKT